MVSHIQKFVPAILAAILSSCGYEAGEKMPPENSTQNTSVISPGDSIDNALLASNDLTEPEQLSDNKTQKFPPPEINESGSDDPGSGELDLEGESEYMEYSMTDLVVSRKTDGGQNGNPGSANTGFQDSEKRKIIFTPEIKNPTTEEGTVSVEVKVDKDGKVISVKNVKDQKTNTGNQKLIDEAKRIAFMYKFEPTQVDEITTEVVHIQFSI